MKSHEAALVCSAIGTLLYINTLDCKFCFDDHSAIELNKDLLPQTPWSRLMENDFWGTSMLSPTSHKSYRPLTVATFRLNYMLHELQPLGYHLVNVLLHSAVCYLYVLLCGVVFSEVWPALIAGLLFAVHPIHTEAVAGVVGRAELLCSIFYLLTLLCYRKATQKSGCTNWKWLCAALVSVLCSSLSKEQGITAVAVGLAFDVLYHVQVDGAALMHFELRLNHHSEREAALVPRLISFAGRVVTLALFSIAFMTLRLQLMGGTMPTFYLEETNPATLELTPYRQLYWFYLCFSNVWLLLSPSSLCADWSNGTIPLIHSFADVRNFSTLLLFVTIATLLIIAVRREKTNILFALSLLILPYLPASNLFFPVGFVVAERILYLPSMGFCMLVAIVCQELMNRGKKWTRLIKPVLLFILLIQSLKVIQRNRDWYSEDVLWKSAVSVNPNNSKVFTNLAKSYEVSDRELALSLAEHALQLQPNVMVQWINVAMLHKSQGRHLKAEEYLRGAMALVPKGKKMAVNVGSRVVNVYGEMANIIKHNSSRLEEAVVLLSKAASLEVAPLMKAYWMMEAGNCYLQLNNLERAKIAFLSAHKVAPESVDTNYNLAVVYGQEEDFEMAEKYLRQALKISLNHISAVTGLANILGESEDSRRQEEAFNWHERATQLEPTNHKPPWRMGKLHMKRREFAQAKDAFLRALQLSPSSVPVLYSLGKLYIAQELYDSAVEVLEKVFAAAPESTHGAKLLAEAYRHTGKLEKARALERRLLQAGSTTPNIGRETEKAVRQMTGEVAGETRETGVERDSNSSNDSGPVSETKKKHVDIREHIVGTEFVQP